MRVKSLMAAHVPQELLQQWLQHVRDFDTANPGCHFEIVMDAPNLSIAEMIEKLRIDPELTITEVIDRKP